MQKQKKEIYLKIFDVLNESLEAADKIFYTLRYRFILIILYYFN